MRFHSGRGGTPDWFAAVVNAFQGIVLHRQPQRHLTSALHTLPPPSNRLERTLLRGLACETVGKLIASSSGAQTSSLDIHALLRLVGPPEAPAVDRLVGDTKQFIDRHYAERVSLSMLAARAGVDRRRLARLFSQQMGVSVREYLEIVRVNRGVILIASGMKIEATALFVGYRSKKDFYRVFHRRTGVTPGAFRSGNTACAS